MEGKDRKITGVKAVIQGLSDKREKWYEKECSSGFVSNIIL